MATINWTVGTYAADDNKNIFGSRDVTSGAHTSSGAAGAVTNLSPSVGEVVDLTASADAWVRFGGRTSAVGTGYFLPANQSKQFEIGPGDDGAVSVIDA